MQRREFCKLMAAAAAAQCDSQHRPSRTSTPAGFNKLRQTYEEFCATPEKDRVFYALVDGKIVETKLNDADWSPTGWGQPPNCPAAHGMASPCRPRSTASAAKALTRRIGIRCCNTTRPNGIATPSSASGRTGARSACPKTATGTRATCMRKALRTTSSSIATYGHPSSFGYKDLTRAVDAAQLGTGSADRALQECRRAAVHCARQSP